MIFHLAISLVVLGFSCMVLTAQKFTCEISYREPTTGLLVHVEHLTLPVKGEWRGYFKDRPDALKSVPLSKYSFCFKKYFELEKREDVYKLLAECKKLRLENPKLLPAKYEIASINYSDGAHSCYAGYNGRLLMDPKLRFNLEYVISTLQ